VETEVWVEESIFTVMKETIKCIKHTDRIATILCGHVHHPDGFMVIAGWCGECNHKIRDSYIQWSFQKVCRKNNRSWDGCFGIWKREHGISENERWGPVILRAPA
jgi:hypothetical protein